MELGVHLWLTKYTKTRLCCTHLSQTERFLSGIFSKQLKAGDSSHRPFWRKKKPPISLWQEHQQTQSSTWNLPKDGGKALSYALGLLAITGPQAELSCTFWAEVGALSTRRFYLLICSAPLSEGLKFPFPTAPELLFCSTLSAACRLVQKEMPWSYGSMATRGKLAEPSKPNFSYSVLWASQHTLPLKLSSPLGRYSYSATRPLMLKWQYLINNVCALRSIFGSSLQPTPIPGTEEYLCALVFTKAFEQYTYSCCLLSGQKVTFFRQT